MGGPRDRSNSGCRRVHPPNYQCRQVDRLRHLVIQNREAFHNSHYPVRSHTGVDYDCVYSYRLGQRARSCREQNAKNL